MNWSAIFTTAWNAALQFGVGFGTAYFSGAGTNASLAAGLTALGTGQIALHQTAPTAKK